MVTNSEPPATIPPRSAEDLQPSKANLLPAESPHRLNPFFYSPIHVHAYPRRRAVKVGNNPSFNAGGEGRATRTSTAQNTSCQPTLGAKAELQEPRPPSQHKLHPQLPPLRNTTDNPSSSTRSRTRPGLINLPPVLAASFRHYPLHAGVALRRVSSTRTSTS